MTDREATAPGAIREASRAAIDFRASLGRRRESEDLLAAARAARLEAMDEAAEVVRVAESVARRIEDAARSAALAMLAEATDRAGRVLAQAQEEVARLGADAGGAGCWAPVSQAAEVTKADVDHHEQVSAAIGRLDAMASDIQMVVDRTMAELTDALAPLARQADSRATAPPAAPATNGELVRPPTTWHDRWLTRSRTTR